MKLEIDKTHQSTDISKLTTAKKTMKRTLFGTTLVLTLFSGSLPVLAQDQKEPQQTTQTSANHEEEDIIEIPEIYKYNVEVEAQTTDGTITKSDLKNIVSLMLPMEDNSSLAWLNECDNLENITCIIKNEDTSAWKQVEGLKGLKSVTLMNGGDLSYRTITEEDFAFLKDSPNLESLAIINTDIEPSLIESLSQLKKLILNSTSGIPNLNYNKLTFLDELDFGTQGPYDIAISFNTEEYNTLTEQGVNVTSSKEGTIEKVMEINQRLDEIVKGLNITKESSDQEKLNAILIYTLENLTYDEEVSEALQNNTEHEKLSNSFYEGGNLYGALEKDSAICGNYAALVSSLADRINLSTYFLISQNHAWNLVEVEGESYYVDATWLDSQKQTSEHTKVERDDLGTIISQETTIEFIAAEDAIKAGKTEGMQWYMEDPTNIENIDKDNSHEVINMPSYLVLEERKESPSAEEKKESVQQQIEETELTSVEERKESVQQQIEETESTSAEEISTKKFHLNVGPRKFIIAGGALVGIATALGAAVGVTKKKKRDKIRRQNYQNMNDFDIEWTDYNNDDPFANSSKRRR